MTETVYSRAADIIRERGLARGVYEAKDGRVCMIGAVSVAKGRRLVDYEELKLLERVTGSRFVACWSDTHSLEDVLLALTQAHVEAGGG